MITQSSPRVEQKDKIKKSERTRKTNHSSRVPQAPKNDNHTKELQDIQYKSIYINCKDIEILSVDIHTHMVHWSYLPITINNCVPYCTYLPLHITSLAKRAH